MTRLWPALALGLTVLVLAGAVAAPPVVGPPPVSIEARVQKDFRYRPDDTRARQSSTYTASSVGFDYTGRIGPTRPLDVGAVDLTTGEYLISFSLPARFSGLTDSPLVCALVESESGIPLASAETVSFESGAAWAVLESETPIALPEMTVALRCATDVDTVGRIEIGESSLLALRIV